MGIEQQLQSTRGQTDVWRLAVPGFCASFVSIGLARFAYTPLLPALVAGGWFSPGAAAYLAATNLGGYLAGVLAAGVAARRYPVPLIVRAAMLAASLSLLACAMPGGALWFFAWRFLSGVAGGLVMILAAPAIFPHVPPSRRGFVSGTIFMGVGFGIALSGTLVPLLLKQGITTAWLGLGATAAAFTFVGWSGWLAPQPMEPHGATKKLRLPLVPLRGLYLIYALNALALVPHMIFLTDFIARGLGQGVASASQYWVLYGLGAVAGPLVAGRAADRWGAGRSLVGALVVQLAFISLPAIDSSPVALIVSSVAVGACTIGIVPLVLGRTREILVHHPAAHFPAWRTATASFALLQAAGAYGMSGLYNWSHGNFGLLFTVAGAAIGLALVVGVLTQRPTEA